MSKVIHSRPWILKGLPLYDRIFFRLSTEFGFRWLKYSRFQKGLHQPTNLPIPFDDRKWREYDASIVLSTDKKGKNLSDIVKEQKKQRKRYEQTPIAVVSYLIDREYPYPEYDVIVLEENGVKFRGRGARTKNKENHEHRFSATTVK
jgi:hypothetical protein